jgi:Fur family transcriptional regulator, ferric uptake regulator
VASTADPDDLARRAPQERSTRQKRALAAALDSSDGFRSAQELHAELRARGENIGLTTVYNQLRALAETGDIDALRADDGETLYRRCDTEAHHHHLVCRHCGRTIEVEGPQVEQWAARVAAKYSYIEVTHTVEILGTCADCTDSLATGAHSKIV